MKSHSLRINLKISYSFLQGQHGTHKDKKKKKTVNLGARMDVSVLCVSKMIQVIRWVDTKGLARGLLPYLRTQSFPPFLFFFFF